MDELKETGTDPFWEIAMSNLENRGAIPKLLVSFLTFLEEKKKLLSLSRSGSLIKTVTVFC
jgi:hypothetical protein